jgi:hypothetical protein
MVKLAATKVADGREKEEKLSNEIVKAYIGAAEKLNQNIDG